MQAAVDAVGEDDPAHPESKIIEMTLIAKDGKITIIDVAHQSPYAFDLFLL